MDELLKDPLLAGVNKNLFVEGIRQNTKNETPFSLFCDIDGVLADFHSKALKVNENIFEIEKQEIEETGQCVKFWEILNEKGPDFWAFLQPLFPLHDLYEVQEHAPNIPIKLLTAQPNYHGQDSSVIQNFKKGRTDWVKWNLRFLDPAPEKHLIMCDRAEKKNHAPGCILIDDYGKNCKEWEQAGGIAIQVTKGPQNLLFHSIQAIHLLQTASTKLKGGSSSS